MNEVQSSYMPIAVDPERTSVFTAVMGLENEKQTRKCSTKEYYHMTESTMYSRKLNDKKEQTGTQVIESNLPSKKTSVLSNYNMYIQYIIENIDTLLNFYNQDTAKSRFNLYQGRQRAPEIMGNMFIHGTKKI